MAWRPAPIPRPGPVPAPPVALLGLEGLPASAGVGWDRAERGCKLRGDAP